MALNLEARLTRTEAAGYLGVTPQVVGMWKAKGKITAVAVNAKGWPVYLLADLIRVDREVRLTGKSHRYAA